LAPVLDVILVGDFALAALRAGAGFFTGALFFGIEGFEPVVGCVA
jgi:hypothetical protein